MSLEKHGTGGFEHSWFGVGYVCERKAMVAGVRCHGVVCSDKAAEMSRARNPQCQLRFVLFILRAVGRH